MFTDHSVLKYLESKPILGGKFFRWLLLFQEYDFELLVKPGRLNVRPDHLSRIKTREETIIIEDNLPDQMMMDRAMSKKRLAGRTNVSLETTA